ncbi:MAG: hypothetical protein AAF490_14775 [Chloroflexota bacterium]
MLQKDPTHRIAVSYIDKSREYYLNKGFGNPYRWASHDEAPMRPLSKPLSQSRIGLITTAALNEAGGKDRQVYSASSQLIPETLHTHHLFWHKKVTHTNDLGSFLPVKHMNEFVENGRISSLSPRFYGVPTKFSQRQTRQENAPKILDMCQEDGVEVAFLFPL